MRKNILIIKTILRWLLIVLVFPLYLVGYIFILLSKIIRATGFILTANKYSAVDEFEDFFSVSLSTKDVL